MPPHRKVSRWQVGKVAHTRVSNSQKWVKKPSNRLQRSGSQAALSVSSRRQHRRALLGRECSAHVQGAAVHDRLCCFDV